MPFQIIRNDITKVKADAIVNTANPQPRIGSGTDSAIYAAAGAETLLAERKCIGEIEPGKAVSTGAYALDAKYIIHTVGPSWIDGEHGEKDILHACYQNSLTLARELKCRSIAFPLIATGVYGFPKDEALNIALSEIGKFLLIHEMNITLVVFDRKALELSEGIMGDIEQYIDEHTTERIESEEYSGRDPRGNRLREIRLRETRLATKENAVEKRRDNPAEVNTDLYGKNLDDVLGDTGKTFQQRLFELIDASGMKDAAVYKRANVQRQVFSSIRCKPGYKPKKNTVLALAIALHLDLPTTTDLLSRAEIAFSPSNLGDLIVQYFITHRIYDINRINIVLFKYDQPILGS